MGIFIYFSKKFENILIDKSESRNSQNESSKSGFDKKQRSISFPFKWMSITIFLLIPFLIVFYFAGGKQLFLTISGTDIKNVTLDPINPNLVWRLYGNSSLDAYDVLNKKILRTIPKCSSEGMSYEHSKLYVTSKFIIVYDMMKVVAVYNYDNLSLFCTSENIGKLFNEPKMKISDFTLENEHNEYDWQVFKVTNEFGIEKFYNPTNNMIFMTQESLNKYERKRDSINFDHILDTLFIQKNFNKKIFKIGYYHLNRDLVVFSYKYDLMKESSTHLAIAKKTGGLLWSKSIGTLIAKSDDVTEAQFKNTLFGIKSGRTIINGDYIFFESKYDFATSDSNAQKGYTTMAVNLKTGKELWTYNWFFEEYDYRPDPFPN